MNEFELLGFLLQDLREADEEDIGPTSLGKPRGYFRSWSRMVAWLDEAAVAAWRNLPEHRRAQAAGRDHVFADYHLRIAAVTRDYSMTARTEAPAGSRAIHKETFDHV